MNDKIAALGSHSKLQLASDRVAIPAQVVQDVVEAILRDAGCSV